VVSLRERLKDLVVAPAPVEPGLYHYRRELEFLFIPYFHFLAVRTR